MIAFSLLLKPMTGVREANVTTVNKSISLFKDVAAVVAEVATTTTMVMAVAKAVVLLDGEAAMATLLTRLAHQLPWRNGVGQTQEEL